MDGNSTFRHTRTSVLSIVATEAPVVVTSAELDEQLAPAYERLGLRPGLLEGLAGIHERRWWPEGMTFVDGAVAGRGQGARPGRRRPLADRPHDQLVGLARLPRAVDRRRDPPQARACRRRR